MDTLSTADKVSITELKAKAIEATITELKAKAKANAAKAKLAIDDLTAITELTSSLSAADITELEEIYLKDMSKLADTIAELNKSLSEKDVEIDRLIAIRLQKKEKVMKLQNEIIGLTELLNDKELAITELTKTVSDKKSTIRELFEVIRKLNETLCEKNITIRKLTDSHNTLQIKVNKYTSSTSYTAENIASKTVGGRVIKADARLLNEEQLRRNYSILSEVLLETVESLDSMLKVHSSDKHYNDTAATAESKLLENTTVCINVNSPAKAISLRDKYDEYEE